MKWRQYVFITAVFLVINCRTVDGIGLDCTYGMFSFPVIGSIYTCTARVLFDGNVNDDVTIIFGIHQTGKGYENVGGLLLRSQSLQFVPTNIENFFRNMIAIDLSTNHITSINNRHLIPFQNLQYLSLYENNLTSIDGDLFYGLDSMRRISFSTNNIRHVGHDLNLPIDGFIYFSTNPCISQYGDTPDAVADLKLNLLRSCPPTISQIEDSLQSRHNLLAYIDGQVQGLIKHADEVNGEVERLRNDQVNLLDRIAYLERIIGSNLEFLPNDQFLIDTLGRRD